MKRILFTVLCAQILLWPAPSPAQKLFERLPATQSGVEFVNRIEENSEEDNVLAYEYFYNGGGVAAGDLNNDGLPELFFSSNRESNALYLNLGGLRFKEIAKTAGVGGRRKGWKTGVTMADVNADGWLDIYVCYSGRGDDDMRRNQLFINNKNLTFAEKAAEYGLDDPGYGTQSAFFDFDRDGDLDCFLLNHNIKEYRNFENDEIRRTRDPLAGDKLFENRNGKFTDISEQAGIPGNPLGFGLGVAVSDLNGDDWPDLYISNDYNEPDYLLVNDQAGHFRDEAPAALGHMSHFSMGCDVADFNNDGRPDILTLDMLPEDNKRQKLLQGPENYEVYEMMVKTGRHHQLMRNMLHLNTAAAGQPLRFAEIGQLAGVSNTDWSWSALFADFDNDGWKDLYITNGYLRDYTNRDFLRYWGDYLIKKAAAAETPSLLELVRRMPASKIKNYIFRNNGDLTFSNMGEAWGLSEPAVSNGAAYADLDGDGDLEIIVNNINEPAFIYRNNARETNGNGFLQIILSDDRPGNPFATGAKITLDFDDGTQACYEQMPTRGYQSGVTPAILIGLGKKLPRALQVRWPADRPDNRITLVDRPEPNRSIRITPGSGKPAPAQRLPATALQPLALPIRHTEYNFNDFKRQPLLPYMLSRCGPAMAHSDIDGDGLEDLFFGGAKWNPGRLYRQLPGWQFETVDSAVFQAETFCTDADALFFDADRDGDMDLYVASGGYEDYRVDDMNLEDRLYINDGRGHFTRRETGLPSMRVAKSCVRPADFDGDGDLDLFVGGRLIPGQYPLAPPSYMLINDGSGQFTDAAIPFFGPGKHGLGLVTDAAWADLNGDKRPDLVVCGEWAPIRVFFNTGSGFEERTGQLFDKPYSGLWNRLLLRDLDNDGDPDLMAGNFGLNSQLKASDAEPATLVYKDFDGNGSIDPILCFFIQGKSYPFLTRDELLDQITAMRPRFTSYEQFAAAGLSEIFTPAELSGADTLRVNHLATAYFENTGGHFQERPLPLEAQFAPVTVISAGSWTGSEHANDLFLFGNQSAARLRLGRMDACQGVLLHFDRGKGWTTVPPPFQVHGDVRAAALLQQAGVKDALFLLGVNNAPALGFVFTKK